jgi:antimicrobial peptide system SdpB family protein
MRHIISNTLERLSSSKSIIGFARSLLAAGTLLTLLFNDINFIIPQQHLQTLNLNSIKYRCNFFLIFNSSHIVAAQIVGIILLAVVISGYFMQVTSLIHFWISVSFFMLRPVFVGGDNINMLLTLLLIPVCLFDERKNHWNAAAEKNNIIQNIFLFIIKLQVPFIYFDSIHDKLRIKEWINGTVIYYWFTHNFFGLHAALTNIIEPLLRSTPVLIFIAWSTLVFEAFLVVSLVFPPRTKLWLLKLGIIFHFSILLIHGYASFFFVMSAALFLYLYPSQKSFHLKLISL